MEKVKFTTLQLENVKRVVTANFDINQKGLTLIGGKNCQGKTTILDAAAYLVGGEKYKPSNIQRDGSLATAYIKGTLSNGLIVERKGKNSSLTVTDPSGKKSGQAILNGFIEELAINLPKFLNMSNDKKVSQLLNILGVEEELNKIDIEEKVATEKRYDLKKDLERKVAFASEIPVYDDMPSDIIKADELLKQSEAIVLKNAKNQELRSNRTELEQKFHASVARRNQLLEELDTVKKEVSINETNYETARKSAKDLQDESTEELQLKLRNIDRDNAKIRSNMEREKADDEAGQLKSQVKQAETDVADVRAKRTALLDGANLPLPGLSIEDKQITYNGKAWDCMSGMEQIKVATAIVKSLKPECGFILLDGLESFDTENLMELNNWLQAEDLQAIGTRVGTDGDCSIIIEAGEIINQQPQTQKKDIPSW